MTKKLKLIGRFYRSSLMAFGLIMSLIFAGLVLQWGPSLVFTAGWFKLFLYLPALYYIGFYKKQEIYYYFNLGLGKKSLFIGCSLLDYSIFWLLISGVLWVRSILWIV